MAQSPNSAKDVFLEAIELTDRGAREQFVSQACENDPSLRQRVEALILAHERPESLLDQPAGHLAPTQTLPTILEKSGDAIGPYKLLQQIGEGGMGTVFMAEQTEPIQRKVALKVIKPGMDSRQVVARFEAERQALAMMDHVNIARVFDGGATDNGRPYFVMELVHGVPITAYCDDNHLSPRERLELFVPVCLAIQHAHQKGIIHRDIKPSNVMVTLYDGKPVPKVIDFGVAKATEQKLTERTLFTQYGSMVGTLEYMSPEQAEMSALGVDTRSDIYSLGVLLYELLTGSTPLTHKRMKEAAFAEILRMIQDEEPPKPSTRLSDSGEALASISANRHTEPAKLTKLVKGELDWIVMKSLEKDRNRRYDTANGFASDVQRYLADEPVHACPPSTAYRFRKFARRNKVVLATASLVTLAILLAMTNLLVSNVRINRETSQKEIALQEKGTALQEAKTNYAEARVQEALAKSNATQADAQRAIAERNETTARAQELLARRRFYAAQMNLAMQAWERGDLARVLDLLESQRPAPGREDLRAFEWHYLWRLCHGGRRLVLAGHSGYTNSVAFSPDGNTLASSGGDGTVKLWDVATGQVKRTIKAANVNAVDISPDGEAVVAGCSDGRLRLWDLGTGDLRTTFRGHKGAVWTVAIAADGKTLVSGSQDRTVILWDVATGTRQATLEGHGFPVMRVAISPDGKTVASATWPQLPVKVWDVATLRERFEVPGRTVTFSADGTLATTGWFGVRLWDVATGKERGQSPASEMIGEVGVSVFSRDGKTMVFASFTKTVWLWDILSGEFRARLGQQKPIPGIALSPDGSALALTAIDGTIEVWDRAAAVETIPLAHEGGTGTFAFSPDRKTLASGSASGARFWDLATRRVLADVASRPAENDPAQPYTTKHVYTAYAGALAFSPDGTILAIRDDKAVKLVDAATHQEVGTLVGHDQPVYLVVFSADGKFLATLAPDGVKRWDRATRQVTTVIPHCQTSCMALSPDGRTLATAGGSQRVELWDAVTGQRKADLVASGEHFDWTRAVTYSPDGKTLAVGGTHGHISLWDVESERLRAVLRGETQAVATLAFSPDGNTLASGTKRTIKLWEVATGQERITLKRGANLLAFSPDGNTLGVGVRGQVLLLPALTDPAAVPEPLPVPPPGATLPTETGLREAVRGWPDDFSIQLQFGQLLQGQRRFAEAEVCFRTAIRLKPEHFEGHLRLADALGEQQKFGEAELALREAVRLNSNLAQAHDVLGWVLANQNKFVEAEVEFRQVIRLNAAAARGHHGLGWALHKQNKSAEAVASLREAVRLDPSIPYWHDDLGWIYFASGEFAKAEIEFREVIRLKSEFAAGHFALGRALVEQRKFAEAETPLREALRLDPNHRWVPQMLRQTLMTQGKLAVAEKPRMQNSESKNQESQRQAKPQ